MRTLLAVLVLSVWLVPLSTRADIPPPEVEACDKVEKGGKCALPSGGKGTCQDATCERYHPDTGRTEYACVKCLDSQSGTPGTSSTSDGCSLAASSPTGKDALSLALAGSFSFLCFLGIRRNGRERPPAASGDSE